MTAPAAPSPVSGQCLCGAARFTASTRKGRVFDVCHCDMCRRWAGGPWFGVEVADFSAADSTAIRRYRSSDWAERWFCARCGGALAYALVESGQVAVALGALDDATGFVFEKEIFVDEQPAFYRFADDVPRQTGAEVIAEFLAAQEQAVQEQGAHESGAAT